MVHVKQDGKCIINARRIKIDKRVNTRLKDKFKTNNSVQFINGKKSTGHTSCPELILIRPSLSLLSSSSSSSSLSSLLLDFRDFLRSNEHNDLMRINDFLRFAVFSLSPSWLFCCHVEIF